jgi:hypothetical protein
VAGELAKLAPASAAAIIDVLPAGAL